ncbi:MAG TPA: tRNA (adenosine(37)-N6)-threonylcarbamoyltransferase complex dimerization subunit type 1 TsaB [bacterium]|nr:tRNA (adenosine(37)-N6)-threonylcarbamoyltransferase complex dimerization subunit type 1 TsaB [bacterium]
MLKLLIDTSNKEAGAGVYDSGRCLYEEYAEAGRAYNSIIMGLIDRVMEKAGKEAADFDLFCASLGPGSFTGIRVGISVMKAFASALGKGFFGAPVPDIMAVTAEKGLLPAIDAGRGEVYTVAENGEYVIMEENMFFSRFLKGRKAALLSFDARLISLAEKNSAEYRVLPRIELSAFNILAEKNGAANIKEAVYKAGAVYVRRPAAVEKKEGKGEKNEQIGNNI